MLGALCFCLFPSITCWGKQLQGINKQPAHQQDSSSFAIFIILINIDLIINRTPSSSRDFEMCAADECGVFCQLSPGTLTFSSVMPNHLLVNFQFFHLLLLSVSRFSSLVFQFVIQLLLFIISLSFFHKLLPIVLYFRLHCFITWIFHLQKQ